MHSYCSIYLLIYQGESGYLMAGLASVKQLSNYPVSLFG